MKYHFWQEKGEQTGAAGIATQVASALVIVSLCYAAIPAFASAGNSLFATAYSFMEDDAAPAPTAHAAVNILPVSTLASQPVKAGTPSSTAFALNAPVPASQRHDATLPAVNPSMPDRHWCIAEAFNAKLDHSAQETPLQPASNVVTPPVYTGYCQVPGSETSAKMGLPLRSLRQCRAVRT